MLDLAKLIHQAIGIESPRKFIVVCALFGAVIFASLGWLIDKGYRAKLREDAASNGTPSLNQNATDSNCSNVNAGRNATVNCSPTPESKDAPKSPPDP
jgi:hypothetical protein